MNILIKGMEMPKSCDDCSFRIGRFCPYINGWKNNIEKHKTDRHPLCPLTELPPHGRLIDADALYKQLDVWYPSVIESIENAPTIIEAEGGE